MSNSVTFTPKAAILAIGALVVIAVVLGLALSGDDDEGPTAPPEDSEPEQDLAIELADILFVLLAIANEQGIDLDDALERVLEKYRVRDSERWTPIDAGSTSESGGSTP